MLRVNWAGVAAGTLVAYLVGFLWYGLLFDKHWTALSGVDASMLKNPMSMAASFLSILLSVFGLDWIIRRTGSLGWFSGARVGLAVALFFGLSVATNDFFYAIKPFALLPIDFGYILLWFAVAGSIVGGLQRRAKSG